MHDIVVWDAIWKCMMNVHIPLSRPRLLWVTGEYGKQHAARSRCLSGSRGGTADGKTKRGKWDKSIQKPSIFLGISVVYIFEIFWTLEISAVNWFLSPVAFPSCYAAGGLPSFESCMSSMWSDLWARGPRELRRVEKLGPDGLSLDLIQTLMNCPLSCKTSGCCSQATDAGQRVSEFPSTLWILRSDVVEWIQSSCDRQKDSQKWHVWGFVKCWVPQQPWLFLPEMISTWGVKWGCFTISGNTHIIVILQIPKLRIQCQGDFHLISGRFRRHFTSTFDVKICWCTVFGDSGAVA